MFGSSKKAEVERSRLVELRFHEEALRQAITVRYGSDTGEQIVKNARVFLAFLKNGVAPETE